MTPLFLKQILEDPLLLRLERNTLIRQEGYWRELERIEALWKIPNIDSPDCEINGSENYLNFPSETPTTPVFRSVDDLNCSDSQLSPPVCPCLAPKKQKPVSYSDKD